MNRPTPCGICVVELVICFFSGPYSASCLFLKGAVNFALYAVLYENTCERSHGLCLQRILISTVTEYVAFSSCNANLQKFNS